MRGLPFIVATVCLGVLAPIARADKIVVPSDHATIQAAIDAAHRLGEAVAERFGLPVFFYDQAFRGAPGQAPERHNLSEIRRGGLAGLAERMKRDPTWRPDLGPTQPHLTGGATVIGARFFLVAFNAVLASADVALARRIARRVRHSSGGLPALKAIGVALGGRAGSWAGGRAQVSMNLVDYRQTSLAQAFEAVRKEAEALGTTVRETEIIGLIPRAAAAGVTAEELLLPGPLPILEDRLALLG